MNPLAVWARVAVGLTWLLSPLILTASALFRLKQTRRPARSILIGIVLLVNWALFLIFLIRSETPYGAYYRTSSSTDILLLLSFFGLIASIAMSARKWTLSVGHAALITLWVGIAYAPGHWLHRVDWGAVTVDGHSVPAAIYLGQPTDSEAEAVVLVRLHDGRGYFLDFEPGKVREANPSDHVRVPGGVWCIRPMQEGAFHPTLPPEQLNQFRIASNDKRIVVVQF